MGPHDEKQRHRDAEKNPGPQIYYVADLGATLGRTGTFLNGITILQYAGTISFSPTKAKGDPDAFTSERFINEVRGGRVYFNIRRSRSRDRMNGVSVECARWSAFSDAFPTNN